MPKLKLMEDASESDLGFIHGISGPVIVANQMNGTAIHELVKVGHKQLLGEVIRLEGNTATIQVYEDTCGLTYGDPVLRTGRPLTVELGPGLLSTIYDGVQRPLQKIHNTTDSIYIPPGIRLSSISRSAVWEFEPMKLKKGANLIGGDIIGYVYENQLIKHNIMLSPKCFGKLQYIAPPGFYSINEVIVQTEIDHVYKNHTMLQRWPVRQARPTLEKLIPKRPFFTGQRVLDGLFPCAQGSNIMVPGAFGCGKTVIVQNITKFSNSDVVVYVGCGERGNEMTEVLREFSSLKTETNDSSESIMQRTTLIANTSNMPVAAREASVYTGITMAEYFRDQGYHVALLADSTSRWAEALREISSRLGELPADSGYPAYLSTRLASFYERGGRFRCIGNPNRDGSVTILGVISPPAGDLSEPLTAATQSLTQTFWALDKRLAERKHFPSIDCLTSYTESIGHLTPYYESKFPQFMEYRKKALNVLQKENDVKQLMLLTGHESLSNMEKLTLDVANILTDDFLHQNSYSDYDRCCPLNKTFGMLRNIVTFYELAVKAMKKSEQFRGEIETGVKDLEQRLSLMKFLNDGCTNQKLNALLIDMQRLFEDI